MATQKQGLPPFVLLTMAILIWSLSYPTGAFSGGLSVKDNNNGSSSATCCVAKQGIPDSQLSTALNWVCNQPGIDCTPTLQNGPCFLPNTYYAHSSYAFNLYYQKSGHAVDSCDFAGAAMIIPCSSSPINCTYSGGSASNQTSFSPGSSPLGSFSNPTYSKAEMPLSERLGIVALVAFCANNLLLWPALAAL